MCTQAHRGWTLMPGLFVNSSLPYSLRQRFLVKARVTDLADTAKLLDRIFCVHLWSWKGRRLPGFTGVLLRRVQPSCFGWTTDILHFEDFFLSSNSSSNASPSEAAPLTGSCSCMPQSFPKFEHPSHELLKENGFTQQVYQKYRRRCLSGKMPVLCKLYCCYRRF